MRKLGFIVAVLALAGMSAGCRDKFTLPVSPSGIPDGANNPRGPAAMLIWIDKNPGTNTFNLRIGGIPKIGLDDQPHDDASLYSMYVISMSCAQQQNYEATINNSAWMFNADTTLRRNIQYCNGRAKFALRFQSKYQASSSSAPDYRFHWQTFKPEPEVLLAAGVKSAITVDKARTSDGDEHWFISFSMQ